MNIAICDDNLSDLSNIISIIDDYKKANIEKHSINYTIFKNPLDLITTLENSKKYDLVLLDVLMPFMTGIETANEIRKFNESIKIIFLSYSPEFAVESYSVNAYYYVLKPVLKDKLFFLLDKVIYDIEINSKSSFLVKSKTNLNRIYISKLEYAEVIGRTIIYHLTDGTIIESSGSMTELSNRLNAEPCFIKPHRAYIINMGFIDILSPREIKMQSKTLIPIAKNNYAFVKSTYIKFLFEFQKNK